MIFTPISYFNIYNKILWLITLIINIFETSTTYFHVSKICLSFLHDGSFFATYCFFQATLSYAIALRCFFCNMWCNCQLSIYHATLYLFLEPYMHIFYSLLFIHVISIFLLAHSLCVSTKCTYFFCGKKNRIILEICLSY